MRFTIYLLVWILLLGSSCTPARNATQEPEKAYEDTGVHPLETRTGITAIDSILAAVQSGEPQKLIALINYTVAPCTTADGLGGPPKCNAGEPQGTKLEVLPILGSEGGFIRKSEMGKWQGVQANGIYSIYRIADNATAEEYYPAGEYVILLTAPENQPAIALRVANGGIVRIDYLFDSSLESLKLITEQNATEVILAPVIR